MKLKENIFYQTYFEDNLQSINNIKFTQREIDIISFIINGRSTKKIATSLSIAPKTVENYVRNIMLKLECNSREGIIDFIEQSHTLSLVRKHHTNLLIQIEFGKCLIDIARQHNKSPALEVLIYGEEKDLRSPLITFIEASFKTANIACSIENQSSFLSAQSRFKDKNIVFVTPKAWEDKEKELNLILEFLKNKNSTKKNYFLFLLQNNEYNNKLLKQLNIECFIDITDSTNHFFVVLEILKHFCTFPKVDEIIKTFKKQYNFLQNAAPLHPPVSLEVEKKERAQNTLEKRKRQLLDTIKWVIVSILVVGLLGFGFFTFKRDKGQPYPQLAKALTADLFIPVESVLLYRPALITQLDKNFNKAGAIQTIALTGMGGAGKTILARQYAHKQKANLVWEINAETNESLYGSFEKLAYALSETEKDHNLLRSLLEIKNASGKKEKLILFVKERLQLRSPWFLIFDNVENFSDIQKCFPLDVETWGLGKVILTTRNTNIQNSPLVSRVIAIGELMPKEKQELFSRIMGDEKSHVNENGETLAFLKHLPSFPLDVSVAAYYLKSTNIPYAQYAEKLKNYTKEINQLHENILKETGEYTKTRYAIITHSLEHLINSHKDFADLLLFISLLDSQNIPKSLLDQYKDSKIVDNFIYHLKKHSLLTPTATPSSAEATYAMHRSTQMISLAYLTELLKLTKDSSLLKEIAYPLEDYADKIIEQEDFPRMQIIARHIEKLLEHGLLTGFSKGLLGSKLGSIYYFINNAKAKKIIDNSLNILKKSHLENLSPEAILKFARSLLHIGTVYTELRHYQEAQEAFEKAINIYRQQGTKNYADLSWALSHLGNVYRRLGDYETAKGYLEESLQLHKQYGVDKKRMARILAYLGSVYRGLGFYQNSMNVLEESLAIYNKHYAADHFRIGWTLTRLGNVYSDLGEFKKAKQYFEKGLLISKKYFPEDHMSMGLTLTYLGNCYRELGEYEKSRDVLEQSLKIHEKYFDKKYRRMAWVSFYLARTYQALGKHQEAQKLYDKVLEIYANYCDQDDIETGGILRNMARICLEKNRLDEAENFITRSLKVLQSRQHVDAYRSLEVLGEIYLKKSIQSADNKSSQGNERFKAQARARDLLDQALKIAEQNLPKNSIHIERIKSKMKNMQK